jgi:hypothetical protein
MKISRASPRTGAYSRIPMSPGQLLRRSPAPRSLPGAAGQTTVPDAQLHADAVAALDGDGGSAAQAGSSASGVSAR